MRLVVVTGMSGAGKSSVLKMLEDDGYFCVDNLPVQLMMTFAALMEENKSISRAAIGIDIRNGQSFAGLEAAIRQLETAGYECEILFLEAADDVLIKRYKETRRNHPLAQNKRIDQAIEEERKLLSEIKEQADYILDTSHLLVRDLKVQIDKIFVENKNYCNFMITIYSFGFKYGIPIDSDLVFDVRFLANPYYVPELKHKTGNDKEVREFVMSTPQAGAFLEKLEDMLRFLIPNYIAEGKNQIVISIGCTGGKHRSVTLVNELAERLSDTEFGIKTDHRDIQRI